MHPTIQPESLFCSHLLLKHPFFTILDRKVSGESTHTSKLEHMSLGPLSLGVECIERKKGRKKIRTCSQHHPTTIVRLIYSNPRSRTGVVVVVVHHHHHRFSPWREEEIGTDPPIEQMMSF